jgi:hypothetical protein
VGKKTTQHRARRRRRLSVAVVVDNARQSKTDAEEGDADLDAAAAGRYRVWQLVAAAVGLVPIARWLIVERVVRQPIDDPRQPRRSSSASAAARELGRRPSSSSSASPLLFAPRPIVRGVLSYAPPPPPRRRASGATFARQLPDDRGSDRTSRPSSTPSSPITCRIARRRSCSGASSGHRDRAGERSAPGARQLSGDEA